MRRRQLALHRSRFGALLLGLAIVGCAHPVTRKLEGRWLGESVENFPDEEVAVATGWARGTAFEFSGSDVTVSVPAEEPRSGRYSVSSAHQGQIVLAVKDSDGKSDRARFSLIDEHLLRWHVNDERAVLLRREQ